MRTLLFVNYPRRGRVGDSGPVLGPVEGGRGVAPRRAGHAGDFFG